MSEILAKSNTVFGIEHDYKIDEDVYLSQFLPDSYRFKFLRHVFYGNSNPNRVNESTIFELRECLILNYKKDTVFSKIVTLKYISEKIDSETDFHYSLKYDLLNRTPLKNVVTYTLKDKETFYENLNLLISDYITYKEYFHHIPEKQIKDYNPLTQRVLLGFLNFFTKKFVDTKEILFYKEICNDIKRYNYTLDDKGKENLIIKMINSFDQNFKHLNKEISDKNIAVALYFVLNPKGEIRNGVNFTETFIKIIKMIEENNFKTDLNDKDENQDENSNTFENKKLLDVDLKILEILFLFEYAVNNGKVVRTSEVIKLFLEKFEDSEQFLEKINKNIDLLYSESSRKFINNKIFTVENKLIKNITIFEKLNEIFETGKQNMGYAQFPEKNDYEQLLKNIEIFVNKNNNKQEVYTNEVSEDILDFILLLEYISKTNSYNSMLLWSLAQSNKSYNLEDFNKNLYYFKTLKAEEYIESRKAELKIPGNNKNVFDILNYIKNIALEINPTGYNTLDSKLLLENLPEFLEKLKIFKKIQSDIKKEEELLNKEEESSETNSEDLTSNLEELEELIVNNSEEVNEASIFNIVSFGVKIGLGQAAQNSAIEKLKSLHPLTESILSNPLILSAIKIVLPIIGKFISSKISQKEIAEKIESVSEGLLLANSIQIGAEFSNEVFDFAKNILRIVFKIFNLSEEEVKEAEIKMLSDYGVDEIFAKEMEEVEALKVN